jgi:hypothetical protein
MPQVHGAGLDPASVHIADVRFDSHSAGGEHTVISHDGNIA